MPAPLLADVDLRLIEVGMRLGFTVDSIAADVYAQGADPVPVELWQAVRDHVKAVDPHYLPTEPERDPDDDWL